METVVMASLVSVLGALVAAVAGVLRRMRVCKCCGSEIACTEERKRVERVASRARVVARTASSFDADEFEQACAIYRERRAAALLAASADEIMPALDMSRDQA